jgi:hypothetical protein
MARLVPFFGFSGAFRGRIPTQRGLEGGEGTRGREVAFHLISKQVCH